MHIALLHLRVRIEERLLFDALESLGAAVDMIDLRSVVFDPAAIGQWSRFDAVLDRSLSLTSSLNATRILEGLGLRCVNPSHTADVCGDKLRTTIALEQARIPTPSVRVALDAESALQAVEQIGYPAVLKPTVGSWGRMVARVNDRDAAEAVIEHRDQLGSAQHHVYYVQEHIAKPGRDIRVFVVGGRAIAAIVRTSEHWVTNTARGAKASGLTVTDEIADLCTRSAAAVGADVCAIDLLECPRRGLLVNEVNHSMEFRNSIDTTGVNIPLHIAEHVMAIACEQRAACDPVQPVVRTIQGVGA
ncbi:MAG: lysine biosynthesis protein LysX [Leptolyngbya sp. PLA3]|nr:MAG: lysine biosynthesis protein LysX [Cyanobacteria bacterium CYA]MCE7969708.1 lysine biosynthesis protein LysX [Leptolyngbya sp. PL-A3]